VMTFLLNVQMEETCVHSETDMGHFHKLICDVY